MANKFNPDIINEWVKFWNIYDLSLVEKLFVKDNRVTYFSSEKQGIIKGFESLVKHHENFGFVRGGKAQHNKLWLEDVDIEDFGDSAIVCATWYFQRPNIDRPQRGPVKIVYVRTGNDWRIAHANFGNYKKGSLKKLAFLLLIL